jgi:hypothetical protein
MMDKPVKCDSKYKTLPGAAQQQIMKLWQFIYVCTKVMLHNFCFVIRTMKETV